MIIQVCVCLCNWDEDVNKPRSMVELTHAREWMRLCFYSGFYKPQADPPINDINKEHDSHHLLVQPAYHCDIICECSS